MKWSAFSTWLGPERGFAIHPQDLTPEEEAAAVAAARRLMAVNAPPFVSFMALCLLALWPIDLLVFRDDPRLLSLFAQWRGAIVVFLLGGVYVARRTGAIQRWPARLCALVVVVVFSVTAFYMGQVGGMDGPWFYFLLATPLFTIPLLLPLRLRVVTNLCLLVGSVGCYLLARPEALTYLSLAPAVSAYVFTGALSAVLGGHLLFLFFRANTTSNSRLVASEAQLRDLTAELERRVDERTVQLKNALRSLEGARMHERAWMARELHDALGQELTALHYGLRVLRKQVGAAAARNAFEPVEELLGRASGTARRILSGLGSAPATVPQLVAAVRKMVLEAEQAAELKASLDASPADLGPVSEPARLAVYRIAQEAITNVLKHSKARRMDVRLTRVDGRLVLRVADDGSGISAPLPTTGLGIGGIQQRVAELGGDVSWSRAPGGGTVMEAFVPCQL